MFKCEITEHFGPFCGMGGYGSITKIGMDRSPKKAVEKARRFCSQDGSQLRKVSNDGGGGVPILREFRLYRGSKLIKSTWN